jgi:APA family basic amino acid/polyamine antiporter
VLTAPRVYFATAETAFFGSWPGFTRTRVPVVAIVLQGLLAAVIARSGRYEQILNYVVSVDFIAMGLTAATLFVYRRRGETGSFRVPGHPLTTVFFVVSCWAVVASAVFRHPGDTVIGLGIMVIGLPAYLFWTRRRGCGEPSLGYLSPWETGCPSSEVMSGRPAGGQGREASRRGPPWPSNVSGQPMPS